MASCNCISCYVVVSMIGLVLFCSYVWICLKWYAICKERKVHRSKSCCDCKKCGCPEVCNTECNQCGQDNVECAECQCTVTQCGCPRKDCEPTEYQPVTCWSPNKQKCTKLSLEPCVEACEKTNQQPCLAICPPGAKCKPICGEESICGEEHVKVECPEVNQVTTDDIISEYEKRAQRQETIKKKPIIVGESDQVHEVIGEDCADHPADCKCLHCRSELRTLRAKKRIIERQKEISKDCA